MTQTSQKCAQLFLTTMNSNFPVFCPAQKVAPFYEEWWFLVVVALVGLIFILLLVFILIIRGQSKKYAKKSESGECTQLNREFLTRLLTIIKVLYLLTQWHGGLGI